MDVRYPLISIIETLLRVLPIPTGTGLIRIGNPGRNSPVLLTCNFHLTVERVKRALKGLDVYLLVANSRGINVWCAAAGGLFTDHDVISALKTSGIEDLVDHRRVILPQLAATGIRSKVIRERTGWNAIFGPVYAEDLPEFLRSGFKKDERMRKVKFNTSQRLEIAVAWAFPISVIAAVATFPFWPQVTLPLVALTWGLSLLIFLLFPLYQRWLNPRGKRLGLVFFDFGRGGFQLILWALLLAGLAIHSASTGSFGWGSFLKWGIISLVVILLLSIDLMGSTPLYKSGLHEDRLFEVVLDKGRCRGAGLCQDVCPRNCFEVDRKLHTAEMPRAELCVQCGACIVQCPFDALSFRTPEGGTVPPEVIRRYKLNFMGKRARKV